jgi:hypothetical protein
MNWVEITDPSTADYIYKQLIKLKPYESHNSLHVWEDRYLLDDAHYRVFTIMSQPDYWTLEVLK